MELENRALGYFSYGQSSILPEAVLVKTLTRAQLFVLIMDFINLINLLYVHLPVQLALKLNEVCGYFVVLGFFFFF